MTVSWNFDTAEGVGSVPIPGGDPLHGGFHTVKYAVDPGVTAAVFVPDYELSTEKAREALPGEVAYRDAVFNVSRVALMAAAMNARARSRPAKSRTRCCTLPRRIACTSRIARGSCSRHGT